MRTFSVSAFKTHALGIFDAVSQTGEKILVTKRGNPIAVVEPYHEPERTLLPGKLAATISFAEDLVAPLEKKPSPRKGPK